ncbi:ABC transporter substrate-binding protein [Rubrivivax gelatinosus]|uniref:Amino acid/amide ABC transporter substrate-binding protein (HAAT family) n=1 Tax=Rubrivivax gelatinosus TaxID=28068 RepID=A0A4R2M3T3_RUBGE|nr:ABC transporter substrate-binding protein [Rubrivivax gelatinosus]MBK1687167.1 amino acid ABC transporter substrate-binding protein [Rubrivivax gelatinosus]TCP00681.1 amino acid/amide ABC transporter substrate-binding protein (HAAT family) [Rubrivivax gelatinosus]
MRELRRLAAVLCLGVLTSFAATAQILIGQTTGLTGPAAAGANENVLGAKLWFDRVNASGGIGGRRIELVTLDDRFEPARAAENALRLIMVRQVTALFLNRGTPHTEAIRPMLAQYQVPLVAPSTGAMLLHKPVDPWIFNVRAPYQREAEKLVHHLASIGMSRIGLAHVDDSFGADAAAGATRGFEHAKLKPVFVETFDRARPVFSALVQKAKAGDVQAVVFIGTAEAVSEGTQALRAAGSRAQIGTLSNNASSGFVKAMGEHASGTIVAQVFPSERALSTSMVREASELARAAGINELTPAMIEGFAGARVLVEGLRRAGPNPTRQSLRQALEGFQRVDLGGLEISYGPADHSGLDYTELSIISDGRFRR